MSAISRENIIGTLVFITLGVLQKSLVVCFDVFISCFLCAISNLLKYHFYKLQKNMNEAAAKKQSLTLSIYVKVQYSAAVFEHELLLFLTNLVMQNCRNNIAKYKYQKVRSLSKIVPAKFCYW